MVKFHALTRLLETTPPTILGVDFSFGRSLLAVCQLLRMQSRSSKKKKKNVGDLLDNAEIRRLSSKKKSRQPNNSLSCSLRPAHETGHFNLHVCVTGLAGFTRQHMTKLFGQPRYVDVSREGLTA